MVEKSAAERKARLEGGAPNVAEDNGAGKTEVKAVAGPAERAGVRASAGNRAAEPPRQPPVGRIHPVEPAEEWARVLLRQTPGWLISMLVHVILLMALALITLPPETADELRQLMVAAPETEEFDTLEELLDSPLEEIDVTKTQWFTIEPQAVPEMDVAAVDDIASGAVGVELRELGLETALRSDLLTSVGAMAGNALSGRSEAAARARLVALAGGNAASERAVAAALKWLAEHQYSDGGWSFDMRTHSRCRGQCRNPSRHLADARIAATGLALLPFLGAGQTHKTGKYKDTVKSGLYFLISRMRIGPQGGSLYEPGGTMYSHGITAIVLCEAYAMTKDRDLYAPAQQAINFICFAQDPVGGGWRYEPHQPGDTSMVGWQLMALKSGHMGYLQIPPLVVQRASLFLDTVQSNNGANYGYARPGDGKAQTAIGLLCRMYLGWRKDNPALEQGVRWLAAHGPDETDLYYNYYATQVMRHWEGDLWKQWNEVMRDQLIRSQATRGHETGSWLMGGSGHNGNEQGGRLYCTAMATMILEVYYRHLPIYQKQSTEDDFPLD